jgi:hypothetical protein
MPLPNVLIIGAMKAGTTSLYMDLATHPQGFLAQDKEPHALTSDHVLTARGRAEYEAIYASARPDQIRCDASTGYTKRPDVEGAAQRALQVLPAGFKVVYAVRHPIDRIVSQHHHEHAEGRVGPSIDDEVRRHSRYVQYSRYSYQLQPWLEAVGRQRICVIRFEDYVASRQEELARLCDFLGYATPPQVSAEPEVYNKSSGKPVKTKFWNAIQHNGAYRKLLRPLTPVKFRLAVQRLLLPKAPDRLPPPSPDTRAFLYDALREDMGRFGKLLKTDEPFWPDFALPPPVPNKS